MNPPHRLLARSRRGFFRVRTLASEITEPVTCAVLTSPTQHEASFSRRAKRPSLADRAVGSREDRTDIQNQAWSKAGEPI
jgi:hypothetical protein